MSTLGVVALVLAALVVAAVVILYRVVRRAPGESSGSPRTVADLVRMRAEQAADAPPLAPEAAEVTPAEETPAPVDAVPADAEPATAVAEPAAPIPAAPAPAPDGEAPAASPVPAPAPAVRADAPAIAQLPGSDTPWGRAARMADGDGAVWASSEPDHEWSEWLDWADIDETESGVPDQAEPRLRPVVLPPVSPELFGPRRAADPSPVAEQADDTPAVAPTPAAPTPAAPTPAASAAPPRPALALVRDAAPAEPDPAPASEPDATPEELAVRRRTAAETAAEQAAADLALLRTFGCDPAGSAVPAVDDEDDTPLAPAVAPAAPAPVTGSAQTVAFRVVGRDGDGIDGAGVTLLDDRGQETTTAVADAKGRGEVRAPHPGGYVLVSAAPGHQPGAVAVTVGGEPVEAEVLLARSASVAGTVFGEDGPIVGARLTLVQDGEIVDTTGTGPGGEYWICDLAAGEYGLSVSAHDCEPAAVLITVPDETDLRHDVELVPAGLPAPAAADGDVMIGHG